MKRCKHIGLMYPVEDRFGWVVGYLCDCGYFEHRKDMPTYRERQLQFMKKK